MKKNRLVVPARKRSRSRARHGSPSDDQQTRRRLLEAAGEVFAAKGFERATGKEIAARAGANAAAVNYHFGGMAGLYGAVFEEAQSRLVTFESLQAAVAGAAGPAAKLEAFIGVLVRALTGPLATSWAVRIIGRETVSPSGLIDAAKERGIFAKLRLVRAIVAELLGLPEDHPAVPRSTISVMAPCFLLLTVHRGVLGRRFPDLGVGPADAEALHRHLVRFALAGLAASARDAARK